MRVINEKELNPTRSKQILVICNLNGNSRFQQRKKWNFKKFYYVHLAFRIQDYAAKRKYTSHGLEIRNEGEIWKFLSAAMPITIFSSIFQAI